MFVVSRHQAEAFRRESILRFTEEMTGHMRALFAEHVAHLAERALYQRVQLCIEKALTHQLFIEGDIQRYLECCVLLGWDFDVKPETQWAAKILREQGMNGEVKMDRIEQGLLVHAPRTWGP
jgi:hypothetical protein